jgi:hypothetical protein
MAEAENRALVGNRFTSQVDPRESAHRARLIQRFFRAGVGQVEPVLQEIDAQYPLQPDRRASIAGLVVVRLYPLTQLLPGNDLIHHGQKLFKSRRFSVAFKITAGEGLLFHAFCSGMDNARIIEDVGT